MTLKQIIKDFSFYCPWKAAVANEISIVIKLEWCNLRLIKLPNYNPCQIN